MEAVTEEGPPRIEFEDRGELEEFYQALRAAVAAHVLRGPYLPLEAAAEVIRRARSLGRARRSISQRPVAMIDGSGGQSG
jgi:hypothetical protein